MVQVSRTFPNCVFFSLMAVSWGLTSVEFSCMPSYSQSMGLSKTVSSGTELRARRSLAAVRGKAPRVSGHFL